MSVHRSSHGDSDDSNKESPRFSKTLTKTRKNESTDFHINVNQSMRSSDSTEDTSMESPSRSSRSESVSARTPTIPTAKPRSFLKRDTKKSPRISVDDDDLDNFDGGKTTKPITRRNITSLREDEESDQKFASGFGQRSDRQSPDLFGSTKRRDSNYSSKKSREKSSNSDSSEERFPRSKDSSRRKASLSDHDHEEAARHILTKDTDSVSERFPRSKGSSRRKASLSDHDHDEPAKHILTKDMDLVSDKSIHEYSQSSSEHSRAISNSQKPSPSRPSSAGHKLSDSKVNESTHGVQSTGSDERKGTERRRTQSNIDAISSANNLDLSDSLNAQEEKFATELRPHTSRPSGSAAKPPKPQTPGNHNKKKEKTKVPSVYKFVTSKIDTGRGPIAQDELKKSIDIRVKRQMELLKVQRPRSAGGRNTSRDRSQSQERQRRPSAYENVEPRVNTYRSINFDELNNSQSRADSSQSIKNEIYLEWAKVKDEKKRKEKEEERKLKEYQTEKIDKSDIEKKVRADATKLEIWRQNKEKQIRENALEEKKRQMERKKQEEDSLQNKRENAKFGFEKWKEERDEKLREQKRKEEELQKQLLEKQQSKRLEKMRESEVKVEEWQKKKQERQKKELEQTQTLRKSKIKDIHSSEEEKFKAAQKAYEDWLVKKENEEQNRGFNSSRRNSFSGRQEKAQLPPFLPAGGPKNTGKVQHVAW